MIMDKQKQCVGILEQSTFPLMQDDIETSTPEETIDTYQTQTENLRHASLSPSTLSPNCDTQTRRARIEAIKTQLAHKLYHVNPRSLALAIYNHNIKKHQ